MGRSSTTTKKKRVKANLRVKLDYEKKASTSSNDNESDAELASDDTWQRTPEGNKHVGADRNAPSLPRKIPSRKRTPSPDGDDDDEDSDTSEGTKSDSESETNSDDEDGHENPGTIWTLFFSVCKINDVHRKVLNKLGYTNPAQLETLAYDGTVDIAAFKENGIDHPTAMNIGTFAKFLFLRGDFRKHRTLRSMAKFNLQKQDSRGGSGGYSSDEDAAGMMRLSDGQLSKFSNNDEEFEDYWKEAETTLKRTPFGKLLDQPPSRRDKKAKTVNGSLHWNLASAFNGTDAEHVVTEAGTTHKNSGHHTSKAILNYYRSDDRRAEVQRRMRNRISALKLDGSDSSAPSIKAYTNDFKKLVEKLKTAKEKWTNSKQKTEYLKNINLPHGHPLMIMKVICASETGIRFQETVQRLILAAASDDAETAESRRAKSRRALETEGIEGTLVPRIPEHVLKAARNADSAHAAVELILQWKQVRNDEDRDLHPDELNEPKPDEGSNSGLPKNGEGKGRRPSLGHERTSKNRRVTETRTATAGSQEHTIEAASEEDDDLSCNSTSSASSDDDDDSEETMSNNDD